MNHFLANVPILYPLKITENLWISDTLREYKIDKLAFCSICQAKFHLKDVRIVPKYSYVIG